MGDPLEPGDENATPDELAARRRSIEDAAADGGGDPDAEPEGQPELPGMPPVELGDLPPTLSKLIPRNATIEVHYSLMSAAVKGKGGLVDPEKAGQLIVSYVPHGYLATPIRSKPGEPGIERWKVTVQLRPTYVMPVEAANPSSATA